MAIIIISRSYGSAGYEVAAWVAHKLRYRFFYKALTQGGENDQP